MNYSNDEKRKIVKDDYDAIAENFANCYSEINFYEPYIDQFVKSLKGSEILDVGCGAGQFTDYFCKLGFHAKGIDFSDGLLTIAREKYPDVEFINSDICEYKATDLYDGIFTKDMLFHLSDEDIVKTLKLFKNILNQMEKFVL